MSWKPADTAGTAPVGWRGCEGESEHKQNHSSKPASTAGKAPVGWRKSRHELYVKRWWNSPGKPVSTTSKLTRECESSLLPVVSMMTTILCVVLPYAGCFLVGVWYDSLCPPLVKRLLIHYPYVAQSSRMIQESLRVSPRPLPLLSVPWYTR